MVAINVPYGRSARRLRIIDESNSHLYADDRRTRGMRGLEGRDYKRFPYGSMPWSTVPVDIIPRNEWSARIEEGNAKGTWALSHHEYHKVPILNQHQTPYCWVNAVTGALMTSRAIHGLGSVHLSSASCGAPGKNYRSEGGWTGEAIGYGAEYGWALHEHWPNDYIKDDRYFRDTRQEAKLYNIGEWWELTDNRQRVFDEIMTCLLRGHLVTVGLMWWGHAVYYAAPVEISRNNYGVVMVNSWGDEWENGGMSVLAEPKATADEANCIVYPKMSGDQHMKTRRWLREQIWAQAA